MGWGENLFVMFMICDSDVVVVMVDVVMFKVKVNSCISLLSVRLVMILVVVSMFSVGSVLIWMGVWVWIVSRGVSDIVMVI